MAKRVIERVEDQDGLTSETESSEIPMEKEVLPTEKQARPKEEDKPLKPEQSKAPEAVKKEVKPIDISISVKAPGVFVMRVWNGMVLFPDKRRMAKIPIVSGKPVQIRITQ